MRNFIIGTIFGIVVATVGFSGVAKMLDPLANKIKTMAQEHAKD
jgi:hypothetical protein